MLGLCYLKLNCLFTLTASLASLNSKQEKFLPHTLGLRHTKNPIPETTKYYTSRKLNTYANQVL